MKTLKNNFYYCCGILAVITILLSLLLPFVTMELIYTVFVYDDVWMTWIAGIVGFFIIWLKS